MRLLLRHMYIYNYVHVRQEKTTSPHGDISMLLSSGLFQSTRMFYRPVLHAPGREFSVSPAFGFGTTYEAICICRAVPGGDMTVIWRDAMPISIGQVSGYAPAVALPRSAATPVPSSYISAVRI